MGAFTVGDVVLLPFPFSDLSRSKKRPALVLGDAGRNDWLCLQITSQAYGDEAAIPLTEEDYASGSLQRDSFIRPGKLFTAHDSLFIRNIARVQADKISEVRAVIVRFIQNGSLT